MCMFPLHTSRLTAPIMRGLAAVSAVVLATAQQQPVLPINSEFCIDGNGDNVSCGPTTSQQCQREEIWPRPIYHPMDKYCGENDPNGPFVSQYGV